MADYLLIKTAHISLVCASVSLFFVRAFWAFNDQLSLKGRWVKRLPVLIDTFLLGTGVALLQASGLSPLHHHWLTIKLVFLVLYIISGSLALKHRQRKIRLMFALMAVLLISTMVALAILKPSLS
ncbi:MAG: SirB2 family protein [Cellvibrionaceae bacterium]